jgi:hypothetical protein
VVLQTMAKWRLFLTVLPFTLLFALAKLAMHRLGWKPWAFDSLTGAPLQRRLADLLGAVESWLRNSLSLEQLTQQPMGSTWPLRPSRPAGKAPPPRTARPNGPACACSSAAWT